MAPFRKTQVPAGIGDLANPGRFPSNDRPRPSTAQSRSAMLLPPEAFVHVPALAGRVIDPEKSFYRLSRDRLAELDRVAVLL
jgi:hypothetical protein